VKGHVVLIQNTIKKCKQQGDTLIESLKGQGSCYCGS
jgi:hypothetical protein